MRKTLSDKGVSMLKPRAARYAFPDPELRGFYIRVQPSGSKSYVAVTTDQRRKQLWVTIGNCEVLKINEAREKAREIIKRIHDGLPPVDRPKVPHSFRDVSEQWLKRHVQAKGLRSEGEVTRLLKAHVYPVWGEREFLSIRRGDVADLLDEIEDDHGARQADYVLAIIRGIMNWFSTRADDYVPPIVKGMRRTSPKQRERTRILNDDELRAIWKAAEGNGPFGAFIRLALFTAQRRRKLATMRWEDIKLDGTWSIATEEREKGTAGELLLPAAALDIVKTQSRLGDNPFVFAGRGNGPMNGFSKAKRQFDAKLTNVAAWTIHDLRRSARSLMSRAGIRPEIGERLMGHKLQGIAGVYDRHPYADEKRDALQRLAGLIESIVDQPQNVVRITKPRKRR